MTRTDVPSGKAAGKPPADGGWFWMLTEIVQKAAEIGPAALAVYVVLASHANGNRECWPRVERIAALLGCSDRTVKRALHALCEAGLLTRKRKSDGPDSGVYNVYSLVQGDTGVPLKDEQGDTGVLTRGHWCPNKGTNSTLFPGVDNISELDQRTKPKNKKPPVSPKGEETIEFPAGLDNDDFRTAWTEWLAYRREYKPKPLPCTSRTLKAQLKKLAVLGSADAIAEIENSISHGWQSVCYPSKGNSNGNGISRGTFQTGGGGLQAGAMGDQHPARRHERDYSEVGERAG